MEMIRFRSALLALALLGCAAPAPQTPELIRLSTAPSSAFLVAPEPVPPALQVFRQRVDPLEALGLNFEDYPALRLGQDEGPAAPPSDEGPYGSLLDILREFVAPGRWSPAALKVEDGILVARHSPAVLGVLESALQTLREHRGRMIRSRVNLATLRADALARFENIPAASVGLVGTFKRELLSALLRDSKVSGSLAAPTVTTFHGQKSHVMILSQESYVAGFEPDGEKYQPQRGISTEGVVVELRSIANGRQPQQFLLSFEVQVASPAEKVDVRLGSGVLQLPAQGYARISGRCVLHSDQALLLVTRNPDPRKSEFPILAVVIAVDWAD
jgi:hypothetical protein